MIETINLLNTRIANINKRNAMLNLKNGADKREYYRNIKMLRKLTDQKEKALRWEKEHGESVDSTNS